MANNFFDYPKTQIAAQLAPNVKKNGELRREKPATQLDTAGRQWKVLSVMRANRRRPIMKGTNCSTKLGGVYPSTLRHKRRSPVLRLTRGIVYFCFDRGRVIGYHDLHAIVELVIV